MCPEELVTLISTLSISIAKCRTSDEIAWLAATFVLLGDNLASIAVQKDCLESASQASQTNQTTQTGQITHTSQAYFNR